MITVRTSPQYVNRVRQDWMANGGVYGDGGISALVPSNDPFAQLGPTLDLTFAGNPTDLLTASTTAGYTLDTYFTPETYQIAVPYAIWEDGVGLSQKTFAQIVTFTRASTATYFNSAGTLTSAAVDEARFDYNPSTLAPLGFLIEESRTNSIRNNTAQGAVAGTPGTLPTNWALGGIGAGLATQVVGTGTEDGISYLDIRIFGTNSSGSSLFPGVFFDTATGIAGTTGQIWAPSVYLKLAAGTGVTFDLAVHEADSGGVFLRSVGIAGTSGIPTSGALKTQRRSGSVTLGASTAFVRPLIACTVLNGASIDITLRIGLPQLELGAFPTSVIPTTTTALTRSQDRAVVNTLSPWYNSVAGTIYAEFAVTQPSSGGNQFLARFSDNGYNNAIADNINSTGFPSIATVAGGVFDGNAGTAIAVSANTVAKFAGAYATNDLAASLNGGTVGTDNTVTIPSGMTRFDLGSDHAGFNNVKAGHLRRITYYPRRLSNADLQTITT
jgi:hypothetical protein